MVCACLWHRDGVVLHVQSYKIGADCNVYMAKKRQFIQRTGFFVGRMAFLPVVSVAVGGFVAG